MASTLYRNGVIHSPADPFAEAVLVADGRVAWLGAEDSVHTVADGADVVVDLDGALVAPAFVDAHVHLLETGLALGSVDLGASGGVRTLAEALDRVGSAARRHPGGPLLGHGWDETRWPEGRPPTRQELDRATGGRPVHLMRADVHSAVVSTAMAEGAGCVGAQGWDPDGLLTGVAHAMARSATRDVGDATREDLYRAALGVAAAHGVVAVHEHSTPSLDTRAGLARALSLTASADSALPLVVGYRAELCGTEDDARALLEELPGLAGIGGDLTVDGSLGSWTAALREPYADREGAGVLELDTEEIAAHVLAVTAAGRQAAFHAIGDRALDAVLRGVTAAAAGPTARAVQGSAHRVEHAELLGADDVATFAALGLVASVQPAFDALWGGPDRMYARRLGAERASLLNPFAALAAAGVPLALGSDSPVTPVDPWAAVLAAVTHRNPEHRISARAAFRAHTRGGWRAARMDDTGAGEIRLGAPAHLAIWAADTLAVQAPDEGRARWSTDRRAGTPLLPELGEGVAPPRCLRTLRGGVVLHDALG